MNKGVSQCTLKNRLSVIIFGRYKWHNYPPSKFFMYINRKAQILGQDCLLRMCPRNALLGAIDLGHLHGSAQDHALLGAIDLGHILNKNCFHIRKIC